MRRSRTGREVRRDVTIEEFQLLLEKRFGDLGDPTQMVLGSCCPLGLVYDEPNDLSPEPAVVTYKTGLPLLYCQGMSEGWDDTTGFYGANFKNDVERWQYARGLLDGSKARKRWLREHPRDLSKITSRGA